MDRQAEAFRLATPADWRAVATLERIPDSTPVLPPEAFEGWDEAAPGPKTVWEAERALLDRVFDPSAPDGDEDRAAYAALTERAGPRPRSLAPRTAGLFVPWLADAARSVGLPVVLVPGHATRGHGGMRGVFGLMGHHTATPEAAKGDYPSQNVVTNGRAGLAGPLCNYGLGRSGTVYVVAAGCAWHAGASAHAGFTDLNDEFLGVEAEDSGDGVWTAAMRVAYPKLVAGVLRYAKLPVSRYVSHRDAALPRGRKPDPTGLTDAWMRAEAAKYLAPAPAPTPAPTPAPVTTKRRRDNMVEPIEIPAGRWSRRFVLPVGGTAAVTERGWMTFAINGPSQGRVRVWCQTADKGLWDSSEGGKFADGWRYLNFADGRSQLFNFPIPDGTNQINVHTEFPEGGALTIELLARA
jgi:hypothetical protein